MDRVPQDTAKKPDENSPDPAGTLTATSNPPSNDTPDGPKSWGQKYALKTYGFVRNTLANYIVNFAISAGLTYGVVESKAYKAKFEPRIEQFSAFLNKKTGIPKEFTNVTAELFTVTQILLVGGHSLLPIMKWTHDHRNKLQFEIGHKLDLAQEAMGKGNAASKQRIEEYHHVHSLLSLAEHNRKEKDPVAIPLTEKDVALLGKYNINEDLTFNEHKRTWKQVLKARATGMSLTTGMSFLFAAGSYLGTEKGIQAINVKEFLNKQGGKFGEKVYGKVSFIKDPAALGKYTVLELLYTAASKLGFDHMEKKQLRKERLAEEAEARERLARDEVRASHDEAHIAQDKELLAEMGIKPDVTDTQTLHTQRVRATSALEARKKTVEIGEQDFRAREAAKPTDASLAMS